MNLELTEKEYRRLLDLVYIGNWILNSTRGRDRFKDYDRVESKVFSYCDSVKMSSLAEKRGERTFPSREFAQGGIHEAIMDYEDTAFFDILAEELSRRDMDYAGITAENFPELQQRMEAYIEEFEQNGVDRLQLED